MPIFKPKDKPILRGSRFLHFAETLFAVLLAGHLFGYTGMVWVGGACPLLGFLWEVCNKWMPGDHRFGDAWDYWFFVAGALVGGVAYLLVGG